LIVFTQRHRIKLFAQLKFEKAVHSRWKPTKSECTKK
jgi:hypothetical protein